MLWKSTSTSGVLVPPPARLGTTNARSTAQSIRADLRSPARDQQNRTRPLPIKSSHRIRRRAGSVIASKNAEEPVSRGHRRNRCISPPPLTSSRALFARRSFAVTRRAWLLFIALSVIWGIPYLLIKVAVRELTPASLVFLRTTIGALLLLPGVMRRGDLRALLPRWRPILLFTAVEVALPWWLLSDAERRISSSLSGLLVASVPLVGALLSRLSDGHEPLGARRLAGLATGFAGVVEA